MRLRSRILYVLLATLVFFPAITAAQTELTGQTAGGAYYNIVVPDEWTPANGLVIWNHGFSLAPISPDPDLGPLVQVQLGQGFAVAASSYSLTGWAVFESNADNRAMVDVFEAEFGVPEQVFIYGASLGGIVTARDVEEQNLGNVVGAMPICGALGGSRIWDGGLDLRLLYDAVCGDVPGAAIPGGAGGLLFPPDPAFDLNAMGAAVHVCTGILAPPAARTPEQAARLAKILELTALPESFLLTDMGFVTFGLADLVFDPRKLAGSIGSSNTHVVYGDAEIDAQIARVEADSVTKKRFVANYTPTGKVGDTKIVSIHTDKDGLVLVENESEYAAVVPKENLTVGIVVEDVPSHCDFTSAETIAAWEVLRGWVAGLPQPTAQTLQDTCNAIVAGGIAEGPCRISPDFNIADLDGRVRRREVCVPGPRTLCLNGGRFKVEIAWEDFDGNTGPGRSAVLETTDTGSFWFFDDANIEMVVKALDGRQFNGNWWIFYGSLTNVAFEITVTDTETGLVKVYSNPSGNFASVGDTEAF